MFAPGRTLRQILGGFVRSLKILARLLDAGTLWPRRLAAYPPPGNPRAAAAAEL